MLGCKCDAYRPAIPLFRRFPYVATSKWAAIVDEVPSGSVTGTLDTLVDRGHLPLKPRVVFGKVDLLNRFINELINQVIDSLIK